MIGRYYADGQTGTVSGVTYLYRYTSSVSDNTTALPTDNCTTVVYRKFSGDYTENATGYAFGDATTTNVVVGECRPETPEERRERKLREREELHKARRMHQKAVKLFIRVAGYKKWRRLKKRGHLDIVGPSGVRYRLSLGRRIGVYAGDGRLDHELCLVFAEGGFPAMDLLIQQYLLLTSGQEGEAFVKKTAKRWEVLAA